MDFRLIIVKGCAQGTLNSDSKFLETLERDMLLSLSITKIKF